MLTNEEFDILNYFYKLEKSKKEASAKPAKKNAKPKLYDDRHKEQLPQFPDKITQRIIASQSGLSLGTTNKVLKTLKSKKYIKDSAITPAGMRVLKPYKVDNAIIMAAGLSSRFAPISYEKPKGILKVKDEILIERQIKQLKAAGIDEIILVVGYMREEFFYLAEKLDVKILINDDYANRNNFYSLYLAKNYLKNSYVCSSDDYFTQNPFEEYIYTSYYAAEYSAKKTPEYCLVTKGKHDEIVNVLIGGSKAWYMTGHTYWNKEFSKAFINLLKTIVDDPNTAGKLWEDIYRENIKKLPAMVLRKYNNGEIFEFDSLDELRSFDPIFIQNVDSSILNNICKVLKCNKEEIINIVPIKQGLTNLSFMFTVKNKKYVYRHPGAGTDEIINRASETFSQKVALELGLDKTFIYEDKNRGWKISYFIDNCTPFDYHNAKHVKTAMKMGKKLHTCGKKSKFKFDVYENTLEIIEKLGAAQRTSFKDFEVIYSKIQKIAKFLKAEKSPLCLCHNDFYDPNFLVSKKGMFLIDWEYSGMSDYASDLGTFICCSDYTFEQALEVLNIYFEGKMNEEQLIHCVSYVALSAFYWFVWALYKDMCNDPVGEWLYLWYKHAKNFSEKALELIESKGDK
ncbi:MAG: phosphotransferase [Coriobacteriales bacterium]|nr:phosphotransferase [Coriobacteriales bacterium]